MSENISSGRHAMVSVATDPTSVPDPYGIVASTMKDAILNRIVAYTPVDCAEKAVILSYTIQQYYALSSLIRDHELNFNLDRLTSLLDETVEASENAGFRILPLH